VGCLRAVKKQIETQEKELHLAACSATPLRCTTRTLKGDTDEAWKLWTEPSL